MKVIVGILLLLCGTSRLEKNSNRKQEKIAESRAVPLFEL
jgi:hypothetical protein